MDMAMVGCGTKLGYFNKYEIVEGFYVQATHNFVFKCSSLSM
jgi:hypothetical protein